MTGREAATRLHEAPRSRLLFLQKFLREGRRVASVAPSSQTLARAACRYVDPRQPQSIVELGAGTGAVTASALERCHPWSRLLAIEVDMDFVSILRASCPRALVIHGDAEHLDAHLSWAGFERIDVVISGLALPSLTAQARDAVLDCYHRRATPTAWFSQLTVMPLLFWPFYNRLFHEVRFEWALWNAPPGGVYHCRGLRARSGRSQRERSNA